MVTKRKKNTRANAAAVEHVAHRTRAVDVVQQGGGKKASSGGTSKGGGQPGGGKTGGQGG